MITRRDLGVALLAAAATATAFAVVDHGQVLSSAVFDWNTLADKPNEVGSVRAVVNRPTATLDNLEIHITTLNPGQSPHPPHRHPNEELIILRQGTLETLSNGVWKRVGPGSIIFNGSNQLHGLRNVGTEPAVYHVINFKTADTPAPLPEN
jgi:quercetin dioxygenase-like cupin family protein